MVVGWVRVEDLITEGLRFEAGHTLVPDKPGLACELDLAAVRRKAVAPT